VILLAREEGRNVVSEPDHAVIIVIPGTAGLPVAAGVLTLARAIVGAINRAIVGALGAVLGLAFRPPIRLALRLPLAGLFGGGAFGRAFGALG
jgi:hypothetical protein